MPAVLTTGNKPFEPRNDWIKLLKEVMLLKMPYCWELGFPGYKGRSQVKRRVSDKLEKKMARQSWVLQPRD